MAFRDREKERLFPVKLQLWQAPATNPGTYNGKTYEFCLGDDHSDENLHESIRSAALAYFRNRKVPWHDGKSGKPSNHLCCSQAFCVNSWFPFSDQPNLLRKVLIDVGYSVEEVLPFDADAPLSNGQPPFVSFEWIGQRNYLGETRLGRLAADEDRLRGQNFTSADFAFRFRRQDGAVQIVLGEWKYTEMYGNNSIRYSKSNTDRLGIYGQQLQRPCSQIRMPEGIECDSLFFEPFDQMMRLQLLATAMEREHEMDADVVSVLHIAPRANANLLKNITSEKLSVLGSTIHEVWQNLVSEDRFLPFHTEDLIPILTAYAPSGAWADYMKQRYLGMK